MCPEDFIFVDRFGDVFMPDIFMTLQIVLALAGSMGYKAVKYADWLARNDVPHLHSASAPLPAGINFRAANQPLRRRSVSPRGSPKKRSQGDLGAVGGVTKGSRKLRLQRIPRHRFTRSGILDMVKVPGAPVVRMSMMGRREASDVPSAEVSFASPEDCDRVYGAVKMPLERDGIWVSQV